ncbi:MAG: pirin family protein [Mesorhizobium sp.]|nr:pirin family protein [Mesorhizobium sp.]MCO5159994.1 pirin family protein [Mesorhizobium sp.]
MLLKGGRTLIVRDMDGFIIHANMPGWLVPGTHDHGHGPLAMVVESILHPGRLIAMHEHRNDEIVSWVPEGVMRHNDRATGPLVIDHDHLMVMNAGRSFWHSEETLPGDPPLRMLKIFVRPRQADLEPGIQHGPVAPAAPNAWRHLFGPEGGDAPFFVRNAVDFFDVGLDEGARAEFPSMPGRDLYFYVFSGRIAAGGEVFAEGEQGLMPGGGRLPLEAEADSLVVAFLVDPAAPVTRKGTVGDNPKIPPAFAVRWMKRLASLRRLWRGK